MYLIEFFPLSDLCKNLVSTPWLIRNPHVIMVSVILVLSATMLKFLLNWAGIELELLLNWAWY